MMKLIGTPTSPYTRKVRVVLAEKRIEYEFVIDVPYDAGNRACPNSIRSARFRCWCSMTTPRCSIRA